MIIRNFKELYTNVQNYPMHIIAVAVAEDKDTIHAIYNAQRLKIAKSILVGDKKKIENIIESLKIKKEEFTILNIPDKTMAVEKCIQLINDKKADVLMKGLLNTSGLLKGVVKNEKKQNNKSLLSHCAVFELDTMDRLLYITDIGMNISPNVDHKEKIINNTVKLCNSLGINYPKVAVVCAVEKINEKMSATLDAQELVIRNINKVIDDCVVSGPFALDNAVSVHSAKIKGIEDMYAGKSDILLMPNIESGNILYKALNYFTKCKSGGVILGASIPIVLTSRSDSMDTKLNSILLAIHYFIKGI